MYSFSRTIRQTPLTGNIPDQYFTNITGESWNSDYSFLATTRALAAPRVGDDSIHIRFTESSYGRNAITGCSTKQAVEAMCRNFSSVASGMYSGSVVIHNLNHRDPDGNTACREVLEKHFTEIYPEWSRLQKVTDYFHRPFSVLCFIDPDKKNVVLFVEDLTIRKLHFLQCAIFAILPWYFDPAAGMSPLEMDLVNSLLETSSEKYESCLSKIAEQYDFRALTIQTLLAGFETRFEEAEIERVEGEIRGYNDEISRINRNLGEYLRMKADCEIKLLGLQTKIAEGSGESEIMDYFLRNKKLILESVNERDMTFVCMDYLTYFDEDMAKRMIDNPHSYIYTEKPTAISNADAKALMYAIFVDQKLRMKFCSAYRFRLNGHVEGLNEYPYPAGTSECMPNPHIDKYSCLGNYQVTINEMLVKHDYISAIEQCIASCKSLNFGDSAVMSVFMKRFFGRTNINNRCIELPDGSVVGPEDAIKWLKENEEEAVG